MKRIYKPLTEEQIKQIENHLHKEKYKIILLLNYHYEMTLTEITELKIKYFDWKGWGTDTSLNCKCELIGGRLQKRRIVYICPEIMKRISFYIKKNKFYSPENYLFGKKNKIFGKRVYQKLLTQAGFELGISDANRQAETVLNPMRVIVSHRVNLNQESK